MLTLPGILTKILHSLDVGVNHLFKSKLKYEWEKWIMESLHSFTNGGGKCSALFTKMMGWGKIPWGTVTESMIKKSCKNVNYCQKLLKLIVMMIIFRFYVKPFHIYLIWVRFYTKRLISNFFFLFPIK